MVDRARKEGQPELFAGLAPTYVEKDLVANLDERLFFDSLPKWLYRRQSGAVPVCHPVPPAGWLREQLGHPGRQRQPPLLRTRGITTMRRRFPLMALGLTTLVTAATATAATAAIPPTVPFAAAPKAERSRGYPTCASSDNGLPGRGGFEEATPPVRIPRRGATYSPLAVPKDGPHARPSDGLAIPFVFPKVLADGRSFLYIANFRLVEAPSLRTFVTTFRTELGFRDGDWPEIVGNRAFRRYANGAISLRYIGTQYPELPHEDKADQRGKSVFLGLLPVPADGLSAPPDLTGQQALATVHDMNPYLELIPLEEPGRSLAARLVVVSGADWDPRLAWEVHYRFSCWEAADDMQPARVVQDSAYAYVDARAGSLVFGRDTTRGGALLYGPVQQGMGMGCTIDLAAPSGAPNASAPGVRR